MISWARYDEELRRHGSEPSGLSKAPAVLWLTDSPVVDRDALGLTSTILTCDRARHRFVVETEDAERWSTFADQWGANPSWREDLERYGRPETWWVSIVALAALAGEEKK
jgi:hypothetical protein